MTDPIPIVMIHYGPAAYLGETLRAAARSNPHKTVYFLGDATNKKFVPEGVRFLPLAKFDEGEALEKFRTHFQLLAGANHHFRKEGGVDTWLRFVFERWFFIRNFQQEQNLQAFWLFDSDTLIGTSLQEREGRLAGFDATEQCGGRCLNGYIPGRELVADYVEFMAGMFLDEAFLEGQRERLRKHPGLAFTEMDAWQAFRDEKKLSTWHLQKPLEGEAFDDALGITRGWVRADAKIRGRIPTKKVLLDRRGAFFGFPLDAPEPVRFLTLNLSWLPDYMYSRFSVACRPGGRLEYDPDACRAPSLQEPFLLRIQSHWWKLRRALPRFS